MSELNNKGFAITGILYTLYIVFLLIMLAVLAGLQSRKTIMERSLQGLEESFDGRKKNEYINDTLTTKRAPITGKYVFSINKNYLSGIENTGTTKAETGAYYKNQGYNDIDNKGNLNYSIDNGIITATMMKNNVGQGETFGFTTGYANLKAGTVYYIDADIDPNSNVTWGTGTRNNTVEIYLMKDKENRYNTACSESCTSNCTCIVKNKAGAVRFKPTETGTYWLRLDINSSQQNKQVRFSNVSITTTEASVCSTYLNKGDMLNHSIKFITSDCNDYSYNYSFEPLVGGNEMKLKDIYSFEAEKIGG